MNHFEDPLDISASEALARCDRGLSDAEMSEFQEWLKADPRRGAAVARLEHAWARLDALRDWPRPLGAAPDPDLLVCRSPRFHAEVPWAQRDRWQDSSARSRLQPDASDDPTPSQS